MLAALLLAVAAQAQVVRSFDERASFNVRGDVEMIGNVLLTCAPGGSPSCADVQTGAVSGHNGDRNMQFVNIDPGAGFTNSSSADINLPPGAMVLYAGLYWGARANPTDPDRGVIQLREAGAATYQVINAAELDTITGEGDANRRPYLASADITGLVQTAGNGTYFVGDMTAATGSGDSLGLYGGWSLIVLYEDTTQPFRNLTLFDGAAVINTSNDVQVTVSGLLTPLTGAFDTFMGALVWEGDLNWTGDQFLLNGVALSDALNPANNFWNSSITRLGTRFAAKNPDYVNQLAVDLNYVDASGILLNGATTANLEFTTSLDVYFPQALTFVTDLFVPDLVSSFEKTAVDLNGGDLMPGDIIEYTITYENTGQDGATVVVLTDPIPAFTSYVPNSLVILSNAAGAPTGPQTDAAGDDVAEFDPVENRAVFRLGAGADANDGGLVLPSEIASVRFQVQVDNDVSASGQTIVNTATLEYGSQTLPDLEFSGDAEAELTVVDLADLVVVKIVDEATPLVGDNVTFTITVTNDGPADATGVEVVDILPSGYAFVGATASQGTYDENTGLWTVGSLDAGNVATLDIEVTVLETGDYSNTASGTGDQEDPDESNNEDDAQTDPVAAPDLDLVKIITAGDPYAQVGDPISYQLTATNTGNVTLFDAAISDALLDPLNCTPAQPVDLAPGAQLVCTGSYAVTQDDIDNGSVTNVAAAEAVDQDQTPVSAEDEATADGPAHAPAMIVVKLVTDMPDPVVAGAEIEYTITATNTGNVTLDPVVINDDLITPASITCPAVAPGDTCVLVGTYMLEQENIDDGIIINTATGEGTPPVGDPVIDDSKVDQPLPREPALELVKSADPASFTQVGDSIDYSFTVTNTGNVTIDNVAVNDPLLGGAVTCVPDTLAPGDQAACGPVSHTVTQDDMDAGEIFNAATTSGTDPIGTVVEDDDEVTVTGPGHAPALEIVKTLTDAPDPIAVGSVLEYTIIATNTGNVTLAPVVVEDAMITPDSITCPSVAPGDNCELAGTYQVVQADIDNGEIVNTGSGSGTPPSTPDDPDPEPIEEEDETTTPIGQTPSLALDKSADPASFTQVGDSIDYSFTVTNTGNVTIDNVAVNDPLLGGAVACAPTTLQPAESATCGPVSYTVTQDDMNAGEIFNAATATGTDPDGGPVDDEDEVTVPGPGTDPALGLLKSAALIDDNSNGFADVGEVIEYIMTATNNGNVTLAGVTIDDPMIGALDCTPAQPATLQPGDTLVCTGSYEVTQGDVDAGVPIVNTATAMGTDPGGDPVEEEDDTSTPVTPMPALELLKEAALVDDNGTGTADAGEVIEYTLTAINVGNIALADVVIVDDMLDDTPDGLTCVPDLPAMLDIGEELVCTGTYTVTQADVDAGGTIVNHAVASAPDPTDDPVDPQLPPIEAEDEEDVPVTDPEPGLALVKSADPASYNAVGDVIQYSFTVENTGNVTLNGIMADDPLLGGAVACAPTSLAPGEVANCGPVSYTVTQADIDNGQVVNVATGSGTPPATDNDPDPEPVEDTAEVTVPGPDGQPTLNVVKVLTDAPDPIVVGSVLSYTVTATNAGNVTLTNVVVSDTLITPDSTVCPVLVVGDSCVLQGSYTVTQGDIDNGQIFNTGVGDSDQTVPVEETIETPLPTTPGLALNKAMTEADPEPVALGSVLTYTITATNTGDVTLSDVLIVDSMITPDSITCATLLPGDDCVLIGIYTVTEDDVAAGEILNIALVSGQGPDGSPLPEVDTEITTPVGVIPADPPVAVPTTGWLANMTLLLLLFMCGLFLLHCRERHI